MEGFNLAQDIIAVVKRKWPYAAAAALAILLLSIAFA